jgi:glycosyltransferase involved in cell wall biosynthesis
VKTWNLLKWLAAEGHAVTLASFLRGESAGELDAVRRYCTAVHGVPIRRGRVRDVGFLLDSLATRQPFLMRRDRRTAMRRLVLRLAREVGFEIVHADQLNMAQYARLVPNADMVLDAHNALWLLYRRFAATMRRGPRRWLFEREARLLRDYEGEMGRAAKAVLAVSPADRAALAEVIGATARITVMPIAVDPEELPVIPRLAGADRIVHIGTMYWPPNADAVSWFLSDVYPRIHVAAPSIGLDVIGARPSRRLLAQAAALPGVRMVGYVADPTPYLERAGVMVVPLRAGSGMRVKILTALAQGIPVVSTTLGCEGIDVEPGTHVLVADSPAELAAATLRVLGDRTLAETLSRNGRRLIETRYDYRRVYAALRPIYAAAERGGGARRSA